MGETAKLIKPQAGPQTKFLSTDADIIFYGGAAGGGKVTPYDSEVLTPFGFKKLSDLKVGANINNPDGSIQRVRAIYPHKDWQFYKVKFSDGAEVECGLEHLWVTWFSSKENKKSRRLSKSGDKKSKYSLFPDQAKVYSLEEIKDKFDNGYRPLIPVTQAVCFNKTYKSRSSIEPYLLGILLGDGCLTTDRISISRNLLDQDIDFSINKLGYDFNYTKDKTQLYFNKVNKNIDLIESLKKLNLIGTYSDTKFIPQQFLYNTIEKRTDLLQGLMDTDGYISEDGKLYYTTTSKKLADDMRFLIMSLGGLATITQSESSYKDSSGNKIECKKSYDLYIKLPKGVVPFKIKRKLERYKEPKSRLYRKIISIEKSRVCDGACISVDNPNRLYMIDDFVVTHNTYALLLECLRNTHLKDFGAVIFRRTSKQITNEGGLWDTSTDLFINFGAEPRQTNMDWTFPSKMRIKFAHMEHEKNKFDWQGTQIPFIGFDEITHFSRSQFFYMLSRNRSMSGIPGYIRATTNPDATSWVAEFISWWIDQDTGLPIPERDGVVRYFIRVDDSIIWADTKEELIDRYPIQGKFAKSFTFIQSKITDNKILLDKDPQYLANLYSLDRVERGRLLEGNWKIKPATGMYFRSHYFEHVDQAPSFVKRIRYWDRASTKKNATNNPDWTVGVLMSVDSRNVYYVEDVVRLQGSPLEVEQAIKNTASKDGVRTMVGLEQDPGQAGKSEGQYLARQLAGFNVKLYPVSKDKVTRATGFSSQAEAGNVKIVHGAWNTDYISELENFPPESEQEKDDQVDASSGAFNALTSDEVARWTSDMNSQSSTFAGSYSKGGNTTQW